MQRRSLSRRRILTTAALGSAAALLSGATAAADPGQDPHPTPGELTPSDDVSTLALVTQSEINGQPTYYEGNGAISSFRYEPTFYARMETWHQRFRQWTPYHWTVPHRIYSYGVYVNKPGMHGEGRAFDLTRLMVTNRNTGTLFVGFNGRYDQWRSYTGTAFTTARIRYWGTVASLHYHFRHVLSYLDNSDHHNHVHIDNAISGSGDSSYSTSSTTQTLYVQAACQYLWGYSTVIDGIWGPQTQRDSSAVLTRVGSDGVITTQSRWLIFNQSSAQRAWALQP